MSGKPFDTSPRMLIYILLTFQYVFFPDTFLKNDMRKCHLIFPEVRSSEDIADYFIAEVKKLSKSAIICLAPALICLKQIPHEHDGLESNQVSKSRHWFTLAILKNSSITLRLP